MPRAIESDVRAVIRTEPSLSVAPFLEVASVIVDQLAASERGALLTESHHRRIETWLAAHFYAIRDQQYTSKSTGGASATFQGQTGMYLESTQWGQTAMMVDTSGYLAALNKDAKDGGKKVASLFYAGTKPECQ